MARPLAGLAACPALALLLATALPAEGLAQAGAARICVANRGAFVIAAEIHARQPVPTGATSARTLRLVASNASLPALQELCATMPDATDRVVVKVQLHTGLGWRQACEVTIDPVRTATVTVGGTTFNSHCTQ
ncbi:hypothetical protein [Falsiroseomonas sp.]|uniref:hypothetical protein n=1 Tax=Falsiroseomonas sp. TaxID=2870721 RepID=UPI003F71C7AA